MRHSTLRDVDLILIHDRGPPPLTRGVRDSVECEYATPEVEQPQDHQDEHRHEQGEFDEGLSVRDSDACDGADHGFTVSLN